MAGEGEVGTEGKPDGTLAPASSSGSTPDPGSTLPPLTEPLTPQAALARLKARRELAPTGESQSRSPAPPPSPEKSAGETSVETTSPPEDEVEGLLSGAMEEPAGSAGEGTKGDADDPVVFDIDGTQIRRSEAQKGYIRHQDFTVKTQGLAEVRKSFEDATKQASEERTRYGTLLGEQLNTLRAATPQRPDPATKATDPLGYNEQLVEYLSHQEQVRERESEITRLVTEQREADRKLFEVRKTEEQAKMLEAVPSLRNAKTDEQRGKLLGRFKQTALEAGFAEAELARMIDHRVIRVLEWATIGRNAQKGVKTSKSAAPPKPNGNGSAAPPVLPTTSLRATGGGGDPGITTHETKDVKAAQAAYDKEPSLRASVALLKAKRLARQAQS